MTGRSKRVTRRASARARLAVAAAVLAGGGAAGAVALAVSHGGTTAAQSAGFITSSSRHTLSETTGLSKAMNEWDNSPGSSLSTLSETKSTSTFNTVPFHTHMLAVQRGTVAGTAKKEFAVRSWNHALELWHVSRSTRFLNVGGSKAGIAALSGGTMNVWKHRDTGVKSLAKGDLTFVFGEREHGRLVAQLVLFVAPATSASAVTPAAVPSTTATPGTTAAPTATPSTTTNLNGTPVVMGSHS